MQLFLSLKNFHDAGQAMMSEIINCLHPATSVITEIELLCWKSAAEKDLILLNSFINDSTIFESEKDIKLKSFEIRKNFKLPDAIIAATAVVQNLTLITNNKKGFNKINSLQTFNPLTI